MPGLYAPRFAIGRTTAVATAGSCFAQHITRTLRRVGATVLDAEAPPRAMPQEVQRRYGYGLFSGRYGNIYTPRQMRQLLEEVADGAAEARLSGSTSGRFHDAFRPTVEPEGLDTADEVLLHRDYHLARTAGCCGTPRSSSSRSGLTEAWADRETGRVFPLCPGVVAGRFDPLDHALLTFRHRDVLEDLVAIRTLLRRFNPGMKLLLTVSPVPLAATARPGGMCSTRRPRPRRRCARPRPNSSRTMPTPPISRATSWSCTRRWPQPLRAEPAQRPARDRRARDGAVPRRARPPRRRAAPEAEPARPVRGGAAADDPVCDDLLLQAFAR